LRFVSITKEEANVATALASVVDQLPLTLYPPLHRITPFIRNTRIFIASCFHLSLISGRSKKQRPPTLILDERNLGNQAVARNDPGAAELQVRLDKRDNHLISAGIMGGTADGGGLLM
jgi:hypothetical protein